ncbi:GEVED domain-containing protein [Gramella sp. AN32]|uniref:GEVED domain-containing protein n=1 Tax=Christiangramia antarctica TaxID=2058158 RepID=A0ABW5WZW1_9FLAO|nr:GEVED domain-containing protein [Gramella sp. AN32]MCM4155214.1 hypothetical protein [Gramella sp. AN32]
MTKKLYFLLFFGFVFQLNLIAQSNEVAGPVYIDSAKAIPSSSLKKGVIIPAPKKFKEFKPRGRGINRVVPGKGYPKGEDLTAQKEMGSLKARGPQFIFEAAQTFSTPSDPTGAVGPNHYVNAWNTAFSIWDKNGNQLVEPANLSSIGGTFATSAVTDPIVIYDQIANRWVIMEFKTGTPVGLLVAISQGPDPINDGWYTYSFPTNGVDPDYPKISLWSDGYYITSNKESRNADNAQVVYVLERDEMLKGNTAQIVSFPLPGIETNGFYSPAGFQVMGKELPPRGNSPIIYMQDDAWAGVGEDNLKLWLINVNWNNLSSSTIAESQELGAANGVSPFRATFDGGDFSNLSQPNDGADIDALQATMMFMTQYRRFDNHNSVVLNFVVDVEPSAAEHAAIRWYELRQPSAGGNYSVYQEGTYAPDKSDRFSGSIGIDAQGNIGLGYTVLDDSPESPVFPSIRFTGRYVNDPLGLMTLEEGSIVEGVSIDPNARYGDYAHLNIDPSDDLTFWHNAETFDSPYRLNTVGVFKLASDQPDDLAVVRLVSPTDASLTNAEQITVEIRNFGSNPQSNFEVSYSIDGGAPVTETVTQTVGASTSIQYTFETTADLSEIGQTYTITVTTSLENDGNPDNDDISEEVKNLPARDVGVSSIDGPQTDENLTTAEDVTITIENFGGEPQQNIPVSYQIGNNTPVNEVYGPTISVGENAVYTFNQKGNFGTSGRYRITARTKLEDDFDPSNDTQVKSVANLDCIPEGSDCTLGDGISSFELGSILNERIPCGDGYADFITSTTNLDRSQANFTVSVQSRFNETITTANAEKFSMWIDFNDNAVFEDSERVVSSATIPRSIEWFDFDFEIPNDAPLGQHLLRARAGDTSFGGSLNDPCSMMEYGTTHDYSVNIVDSTLDIGDFLMNDAEVVVVSEGNNQFRVIVETMFTEPLRITVHNIIGQKMIENEILNTTDGYVYELDMSYAATGVYLLRVGTRKVGKVTRFIVK